MSRAKTDSRPRADVTDAELAVLQVLWDRGAATVRELADALYPGGDPSHYGTVQKLLQRLQAKRCVSRIARSSPIGFAACVTRESLVDLRLRQVVDQLCAGSLTPLLSHLSRRNELTPAERRELEGFVQVLQQRERTTANPRPAKP
ncbi:MAG TPA: BlaI/MecI/CopY family transcriptional regulator [Planctomycetota bacterium]|nr:BlaI/MecI/CopY family transcriptional regulator [Planctomycetota bacterium]